MSHADAICELIEQYVDGVVAPVREDRDRLAANLAFTEGLLSSAIDAHRAAVAALKAEHAAAQQGHADQIAALDAEIARLNARIAELEAATEPADPGFLPGWGAPVWRDEFDGDLSKWNVRHNALTFDTARNMRENVTIEDGTLHIRAKWLDTPQQAGKQGVITHTSGYLDTIGKFTQQYGRWEIRCRMPADQNTRGALSAFWLRNGLNGEIDIIERWGQGGPMTSGYDPYVKDTGWTTFHSNTNGSSAADYLKTFWRHYQHGIPKDTVDTWHTYAFEYMPDYIATLVDGKEMFRVTPTTPDPQVKGRTLAWLWDARFFGSPFNMRLNLHVGPGTSYWGNPDPSNRALTRDPLDFAVDYVRVYAA